MCVVNKGRSHRLLRKSLLRKEKEVKAAEAAREKEDREFIPSLMNEINDLKNEFMQRDVEIDSFETNRLILKDLFDKGIIDGEGNALK